jgi:hypothetical protein
MKHEITEALAKLGIDTEDVLFEKALKWIDACKKPDMLIKREALIQKLSEYHRKQFAGSIVTKKDGADLVKLIKEYHSGKDANTMKIADLEINQEMPRTRFRLPSFPTLQMATWGLKEGFYLIGADSQVGKTAIFIQIGLDVLRNNPKSVVYLFSLDDRIKKFRERIISCQSYLESGNIEKSITSDFALSKCTHVANGVGVVDKVLDHYRNSAIENIQEYIRQERLFVFDGKFDVSAVEKALENVDEENAIILIDAAYRIKVHGRERFEKEEELVMFLKDLSNEKLVPLFGVKEIKKGDSRGSGTNKETGQRKRSGYSGDDIRGSVLWDYEPDCQIILEKLGESNEPFTNLIRMKVDKNKIRGMEIGCELKLTWNKTIYREVSK